MLAESPNSGGGPTCEAETPPPSPLDPATVRTFGLALAETLESAAGHVPRVVLGAVQRAQRLGLADLSISQMMHFLETGMIC